MQLIRDARRAPELIEVQRGYFEMGSRSIVDPMYLDEVPARECTVDRPFAVGRFPVTVIEFQQYLDAVAPGSSHLAFAKKAASHGERLPMVAVSWHEAVGYCEWLTTLTNRPYRLLSEIEWEYMCRAGTQTPYWWGAAFDPARANCRHEDARNASFRTPESAADVLVSLAYLTPVDRYPPNPWGIHDVHGNVWEWTADLYSDRRTSPEAFAPRMGREAFRSLRGGSWMDPPMSLRSATRSWAYPTARDRNIGFRIARDL